MCARTSVHTRFRPRVLRSAFSFSSLPSPRSFLPPFSLLPRAPPSIDLAHREPSPPILYTSSIFLRTLPFISCSSLPLAKSSLFFDHLYTATTVQPPPEACLFSLSSPLLPFYRSLPHALATLLSSPYLSRARDRPILSSLRALVYNVAASGAAAPSRPAQGRTQPVRATSRIRRVLRDLQRLRSRG